MLYLINIWLMIDIRLPELIVVLVAITGSLLALGMLISMADAPRPAVSRMDTWKDRLPAFPIDIAYFFFKYLNRPEW